MLKKSLSMVVMALFVFSFIAVATLSADETQKIKGTVMSINADTGEMVIKDDAGEMNWCCSGGGGVSANERADELKMTAFNKKKSQLQALGVDTLVTACANCRLTLEEGLEENEMEAWQKLVRVLTHEIMNSVTPISSALTVERLANPRAQIMTNNIDRYCLIFSSFPGTLIPELNSC